MGKVILCWLLMLPSFGCAALEHRTPEERACIAIDYAIFALRDVHEADSARLAKALSYAKACLDGVKRECDRVNVRQ